MVVRRGIVFFGFFWFLVCFILKGEKGVCGRGVEWWGWVEKWDRGGGYC